MRGERLMRDAVSLWLWKYGCSPVFEVYLWRHCCDMVGAKFAHRIGREIPPLEDVVAVELKQSDVSGVISQACDNLRFARTSWAAMPSERIAKMRESTLAKFAENGIGLLSVTGLVAVEFLPPIVNHDANIERSKRKLWTRRVDNRKRATILDLVQ